MLRGVKPEKVEKRLKALFYGAAGVGKTTAAIHFPKPYIIDTERGAENDEYVDLIKIGDGAILQTNDFDDVLNEVKTLLTTKNHGYKTLIIDSLTVVYQDLCDKWALKLTTRDKNGELKGDGTEFQRHRDKADTQIKHLLRLITRLDMNVIITSHGKTKWAKEGEKLIDLGQTFDCYKKLDHYFDLVFEVQKRGNGRVGIVTKTRVKGFKDSDTFNFSYDQISKMYGKEHIEKDSVPEILATEDQVKELKKLIELLKVDNDVVQKWLDKSESETFDEMNSSIIQKCIDSLKSKINEN
jgi:hypothetical protein